MRISLSLTPALSWAQAVPARPAANTPPERRNSLRANPGRTPVFMLCLLSYLWIFTTQHHFRSLEGRRKGGTGKPQRYAVVL